jgi:hypothetical protein
MAGARRGRVGLLLAVSLLLAVAVAGVGVVVIAGPELAPSLMARNGRLAKARRKLLALRAFALFRAPGDRAVLRGGEPPRASKHTP